MLKLAYPLTISLRSGLTATRTQAQLYDGRTGDAFERKTVGSCCTPKAAPPGRRQDARPFHWSHSSSRSNRWAARRSSVVSVSGETPEVALEAYGASYILQEMLTAAHDAGSHKAYEYRQGRVHDRRRHA
jgi:DNA-directed RNA polymerase subunit beta